MNLQAIRGRNQRGIAFLPEALDTDSDYAQLTFEGTHVLTSIKKNPKIPKSTIILDMKHYDSLGLSEGAKIQVQFIKADIPICTEITLQVLSDRLIESDRIVEVFSRKIEDLEPYLDGMILEEGRRYIIEDLGVSLISAKVTPKSRSLNAARVVWPRVLKVYLEAIKNPKRYNFYIIAESGASFEKDDIEYDSGFISRNRTTLNLIEKLLPEILQDLSFFGSLIFSEEFSEFSHDSSTDMDIKAVNEYTTWVQRTIADHSSKHSNPSLAIENGIRFASQFYEENHLPTYVLFISSGTYTQGVNPLPLVRNLLSSTENIFIGCIGVGNSIDDAILNEIAEIGQGIMINLTSTTQLDEVTKEIHLWVTKDV